MIDLTDRTHPQTRTINVLPQDVTAAILRAGRKGWTPTHLTTHTTHITIHLYRHDEPTP